jgi:hypothetical protein
MKNNHHNALAAYVTPLSKNCQIQNNNYYLYNQKQPTYGYDIKLIFTNV